jgi:hypothetical protein
MAVEDALKRVLLDNPKWGNPIHANSRLDIFDARLKRGR